MDGNVSFTLLSISCTINILLVGKGCVDTYLCISFLMLFGLVLFILVLTQNNNYFQKKIYSYVKMIPPTKPEYWVTQSKDIVEVDICVLKNDPETMIMTFVSTQGV